MKIDDAFAALLAGTVFFGSLMWFAILPTVGLLYCLGLLR